MPICLSCTLETNNFPRSEFHYDEDIYNIEESRVLDQEIACKDLSIMVFPDVTVSTKSHCSNVYSRDMGLPGAHGDTIPVEFGISPLEYGDVGGRPAYLNDHRFIFQMT